MGARIKPGEFDADGFRHGRLTGDAHSWFTPDVATSNALCPYCGAHLSGPSAVPSNKEHLIARQFGPARVMTGNEFNVIFRACEKCNSEKADLERHVSSITLFNGPGREVDPAAAEAAARKALKDFHPAMPGVRVGDSNQQSSVEYQHPGMDISFGMHIPPQVYRPYAERLAFIADARLLLVHHLV